MEGKKILKKSALYFIGNFSSKILTALLVPIYAFYINSEILGTYDYSQTIMNILIPVIFVSIWEAIIRFVLGEKNKKDKDKQFASSALFTLGTCCIFIICAIILSTFVKISYVGYFIAMVCASALAQIWQYYSRAKEQNKLYVVSSIMSTVVNLLLNILLILVFKLQIDALYISYICSQLIIFFILEYKMKIIKLINKKNIDFKILKKMIIYSAPLVVNSIAAWLLSGFGRIIIFENLGAKSNGIYTFANKFVTIITTVGNVVTMAILEEAMISLRENKFDDKYPRVLEKVFRIFLSLIIVAIPAITIFYQFISTTEYYESLNLLPFLLLYSVILTMSINFSVIFKAINKNHHQVTTTIIGSITMIVISYLLLNKWGAYAVALGQLISAIVMLLTRYFVSKKFIKYSINWLPILMLVIIYSLISVISIFSNLIIVLISFILSILFVIYINKDFILAILKRRKNNV